MKLHTAPVYAEDVAAHDPRTEGREGVGERREKRRGERGYRRGWSERERRGEREELEKQEKRTAGYMCLCSEES